MVENTHGQIVVEAEIAKAKKLLVLEQTKPKNSNFMRELIEDVLDKPVTQTSVRYASEKKASGN